MLRVRILILRPRSVRQPFRGTCIAVCSRMRCWWLCDAILIRRLCRVMWRRPRRSAGHMSRVPLCVDGSARARGRAGAAVGKFFSFVRPQLSSCFASHPKDRTLYTLKRPPSSFASQDACLQIHDARRHSLYSASTQSASSLPRCCQSSTPRRLALKIASRHYGPHSIVASRHGSQHLPRRAARAEATAPRHARAEEEQSRRHPSPCIGLAA